MRYDNHYCTDINTSTATACSLHLYCVPWALWAAIYTLVEAGLVVCAQIDYSDFNVYVPMAIGKYD